MSFTVACPKPLFPVRSKKFTVQSDMAQNVGASFMKIELVKIEDSGLAEVSSFSQVVLLR